jgi:hypothetical protein
MVSDRLVEYFRYHEIRQLYGSIEGRDRLLQLGPDVQREAKAACSWDINPSGSRLTKSPPAQEGGIRPRRL